MNAKIQLLQKLFYLETEHITKDAYNFLSGFYFPSRHKEGIELSKFNYTHENIKNFSFVFSFKSIIKTEEKVPLIELCELDNKGKRTGHVILRVYIEKNALYIEGKKDMKFPSNTKSKEQIIPIASNCSYLIIGTLSKQKNAIRLCAVKTASKIDLKDMNFKQFPSLNTYFSILIGSSCTLQHTFSGYMGSVLLFNMFFTDDDIDALIEMASSNWASDRISRVSKALLRLAVYELKYAEDIPVKIAVNEAVELAKKYDDEKAFSFINGVLAKVVKDGE
jgi:transcription antitermination factor NusB